MFFNRLGFIFVESRINFFLVEARLLAYLLLHLHN